MTDNTCVDSSWVNRLMGSGVRTGDRPIVCVRTFRNNIRSRRTNRCILNWQPGPDWHRKAEEGGFDPCERWDLFAASLRIRPAENQQRRKGQLFEIIRLIHDLHEAIKGRGIANMKMFNRA